MNGGVVTLGETMGLFHPHGIGPLAQQAAFALGIGGAESNVAIGVTRLGGTASWIGRVGDDPVGERVLRELRAESVRVHVVVDSQARTGLMLKERRTADATRVVYYRAGSAGSRLHPDDLPAAVIAAAGVLHVTGITPAISASAAAAVDAAIDIASAAGVPVSFDVNHRSALWSADAAAASYRRIAARATVVFAGLDEAALLAGADEAAVPTGADALARRIADLGPTEVVIKLGADGCLALIDGTMHRVAAIPVLAVDTVGAGDAFVAGYLAERCAGAGAAARLELAVRAGAFACLGPGDWESAPRRADLALLTAADPVIR